MKTVVGVELFSYAYVNTFFCYNEFAWLIAHWLKTHEFIIYAMWHRARADNLTVCCRKKQMDVIFSCVCPVIDNGFRHNIVKLAFGSTRLSSRGSTATLTKINYDEIHDQ